MTKAAMAGLAVLVGIAGALLYTELPQIKRYMKIKAM